MKKPGDGTKLFPLYEEEYAYSAGIQAYIFGLPLLILERERKVRLTPGFCGMEGIAPVALINQIGHMNDVATSNDILPYTPNNDTVYSGCLFELADEPLILTAPDITDRYWSAEFANCFTQNTFYIGSRSTEGKGGNFALIGPNWEGQDSDIPDGVHIHHLQYNSNMFALRIGVAKGLSDDEIKKDLELVHGYQSKFQMTSLSNFKAQNMGVASVPKEITLESRPEFKGPLSYFQTLAFLLAENPPAAIHEAQVVPFKYIGINVGQPLNVESLSKPVKAGLARAQNMAENIVNWKVKFRGTPYTTRWNKLQQGLYGFKYLDRAAGSLEGLFVHNYVEAIYYSTYECCIMKDGQPAGGEFLDSSFKYIMHIPSDRIPLVNKTLNGFWSLTAYGPDFQLVSNEINRFSVGDRTLKPNEDGSISVYFQSEDPAQELGPAATDNWLPCPKGPNQLFRINYRIYLPLEETQKPEWDNRFIPPIVKRA